MQITYDTKADAMYIKFRDGEFVANREVEEGIIVDMGKENVLLGIEILRVSSRFRPEDLAKVEIQMPLNLAASIWKERKEVPLVVNIQDILNLIGGELRDDSASTEEDIIWSDWDDDIGDYVYRLEPKYKTMVVKWVKKEGL